jgi:hypothetical protein
MKRRRPPHSGPGPAQGARDSRAALLLRGGASMGSVRPGPIVVVKVVALIDREQLDDGPLRVAGTRDIPRGAWRSHL